MKKSKSARACDAWFIIEPSGRIDAFSGAYQKQICIFRWLDNHGYMRRAWREQQDKGYRCVKCRITPPEAKL